MKIYYNPEVKLLLLNYSKESVELLYDNNKNQFKLPLIGPRPPYYAHPLYEPYYPVI